VHNFRIFDALLTLLFDVDGFVADDVVSVDSSEDAPFTPFTEVDDAVVATTTLDGDGAAASKTMTPPLLLRSSEEAGALLPLPSAFIVALAVSFNPLAWYFTSLLFFVDYDVCSL
jgi:hypothetical protein